MTFILNKFKSLAIAVMVLLFFASVVTLSACTSKDSGSENTDTVEAAAEDEEHPEGEGDEEHPEGEDEEHPEGDEEAKEEN